jgi:exodeoxyribonuclease V beta subunit
LADEEEDGQGSLMKLETDDSALQLLTIHASKGLEFPVVFCPYLWHVGSVQHAKTQMKVAVLRQADDWFVDAQDPVSDTSKKEALEQQKEEEFRKLYVALTRARHRLYVGLASVASGGPQHANGSELSCLMQLPGLRSLLSEEGARLFSHSVVLPHDAPLSPPNAAEAADEHSSTAELGPPPVLRHGEASRHPVFTKRSFSSLARFGPHGDQHFHAPDHDTETELRPVAGSGEEDVLSQLGPAGSELGDRMHRALENHLGNHLSVRESVAAFPEAEAWEHALSTMVQAELRLGGEVLTLGGVRESCITEMQFHMPTELFSPMTLSRALLGDPLIAGDAARAEWASHLGSWPFSEFAGFLQGYIDLIFEHGGRWYVMDYKSNRLRGYEGGVVEAAMLQHHYLLQSRIYCIALDRHLRHHVRDYRPEEHFGGVAYVFVRGLPGGGVWFERPGLEALTALSELFSPAQA